jgi:MFS family permease
MATISDRTSYRFVVLSALTSVYAINYLDRQIVSVLASSIKADLNLSDAQLGLLGGIAFALVYSTCSVPFAMLADRTSKVWVITAAMAIWSGFTALCGTAANFVQILFYRMGVGIGEAGGVAPSYAIVAGYFAENERGRALAVFSMGGPLGAAAGFLLGGIIAEVTDWRTAFIAIGLTGVVLAPLFRLLVSEPKRPARPPEVRAPAGEVFSILGGKPTFWLLSLGVGIACIPTAAFLFWIPSIMERSHGLTLIETSRFVSALVLIAGVAGLLAGGWLSDHLGRADRGAYMKIPGLSFCLCSPILCVGMLTNSLPAAFLLITIAFAMTYFYLGPSVAVAQSLVPETMRSTASACFLLVINLISVGGGPLIVGAASDLLTSRFGDNGLRYALVAVLPLYVLGGGMLLLGSKRIGAEAHIDPASDV